MGEDHRARHQPSPEGLYGGTNGEVSWLRDSTRLPGFPVAMSEVPASRAGFPLQWRGRAGIAPASE
jgi:hypothetical protein